MARDATLTRKGLKTPRAAAIAGILFSLLMIISLILINLSVPDNPSVPGEWPKDPILHDGILIALNIISIFAIDSHPQLSSDVIMYSRAITYSILLCIWHEDGRSFHDLDSNCGTAHSGHSAMARVAGIPSCSSFAPEPKLLEINGFARPHMNSIAKRSYPSEKLSA